MDATHYLLELRKRVIQTFLVVFFLFGIAYYFINHLLEGLALPLLNSLSLTRPIIATDITSVFFIPVKLAFYVSLLISMPFIFYQIWSFISPALYTKERQTITPLLFLSILLFYTGALFAYFVALPLTLNFLVKVAPSIVDIRPDLQTYINFVFNVFMAFGLGFQTPVIIFLLIKLKITSIQTLKKNRPYIIIGVLIISMLLTPPDVISQLLLAIPILLLFELGLWLALLQRDNKKPIDSSS